MPSEDGVPAALLASGPLAPNGPLSLSDIKVLLWADLLYKATVPIQSVAYLINRRASDLASDAAGFWAHLDDRFPGTDWASWSEEQVGERFRAYRAAPPSRRREAYRRRVERTGWVHPAAARVLQIWKEQFALLDLHDPGLERSVPLERSADQLLATLRAMGVLQRRRGAVFLDLRDEGEPPRPLLDEDGRQSDWLYLLRELLPASMRFERVWVVSGEERARDLLLLQRVLSRAGSRSLPVLLGPVRLPARASAEQALVESPLPRLWKRYRSLGRAAFRLGTRLYFVGQLGRRAARPFRLEGLDRAMEAAGRLIRDLRPLPGGAGLAAILRRLRGGDGFVDPLRLTRLLLGDPVPAPLGRLLPLFL